MKGQMKRLSSDQIQSENKVLNSSKAENNLSDVIYTYEELISGRPLTFDVDPGKKELLLCDEEFVQIFGMNKVEFGNKPKNGNRLNWRKGQSCFKWIRIEQSLQ